MDKLYSSLAKWLVHNLNGKDEDYEIYKYGFQTGIEQGLFIITCIIIALLINSLGAMLLFLLVFYLVRPYVSGFHCKKFIHCYLLSVASATGVSLLSKYIPINITIVFVILIVLIIVAFFCLLLQAKKIELKEYRYYRRKIVINLSIIGIITLVFFLLKLEQPLSVIMLTLALVNILYYIEKIKKQRNS